MIQCLTHTYTHTKNKAISTNGYARNKNGSFFSLKWFNWMISYLFVDGSLFSIYIYFIALGIGSRRVAMLLTDTHTFERNSHFHQVKSFCSFKECFMCFLLLYSTFDGNV